MMIKISVSFAFLVAPVVLGQYGHTGYHRAAQGNTQQGYLGSVQAFNRFVPSPTYPREDYYQTHGQTQEQPQYNYQTYHTTQSGYQDVNLNRYSQNFAANLLSTQSPQQTAQTSVASQPGYNNIHAPQPVITKHIYFHLPPPDDSATAAPVTVAPPKKTYNIIFIKLPAQKSANAARIQQLINQQAEDKTLIYVLVKKPETQSIQPVTSKPEVFFVKYKEPRSVSLQLGSPVSAPAPLAHGTGLLPGLVNGHGN